jgi:hypothetical protein
MPTRTRLIPALLLTLILTGCGRDTPESVAADASSLMKEFGTALDGVTDEASARDAAAKIDALTARAAAIDERVKKVAATPEGQAAFEKALRSDMEAGKGAGDGFSKMANIAIKNPAAYKIVNDAMTRFEKTMRDLQKK